MTENGGGTPRPWDLPRYTPRVRHRPPVAFAYTDDPAWFRLMVSLAGQPTVERHPDYRGETAT
jgi:hypothetical protein